MENAPLTCVCTRICLKVKVGPQPFYLGERESFELTHQARKSPFKCCLVAALLLEAPESCGERGGGEPD